jgi:hypothetical protein
MPTLDVVIQRIVVRSMDAKNPIQGILFAVVLTGIAILFYGGKAVAKTFYTAAKQSRSDRNKRKEINK